MSLKISIVIPTHDRRDLLEACLRGLEGQDLQSGAFEVIVVMDGPADAAREFLDAYRPPFSFKYFEQENKGVCAARNLGARHAAADLVLCLDDDVVAAPQLVREHLNSHQRDESFGCFVQGGLELHPSLLKTPFLRYQGKLRRAFRKKMQKAGAALEDIDVSGGNFSIAKSALDAVGGFDERLKDLSNTDGNLAYRLGLNGIRFVYNGQALGFLAHMKDFEERLRECFLYGRTYVVMQKDFPETLWKHSPWVYDRRSPLRNSLRLYLLRCSRSRRNYLWIEPRLKRATGVCEALGLTPLAEILYRLIQDFCFWKGVDAESGGDLQRFYPKGIPVLCYHNVSDTRSKEYWRYILPVEKFKRQIRWLRDKGYQTVSLDALFDYLDHGAAIPEKPAVVTFDDGYRDLKTTASPFLAQMGFHHTHFINSGKLGGTTDWVQRAPDLPILSRDDIQEMAALPGSVTEFQAHGKNHLSLRAQDARTALREISECVGDLESLLGKPVRYLAYPYGEHDATAIQAVASANLRAAFTVEPGLCRPGQDFYRLKRVEVFSHDFFLDFILNVKWGWSPIAASRKRLKNMFKKLVRRLRS